ncbi:MAG TPA: MaoC/PaaZ C-terminal domain-containing protein [Burkholderiaceae bacterium]|nr:MaoC/PaaZ C-terminal domain-containing protein [Burkholderiaceae bacterium]
MHDPHPAPIESTHRLDATLPAFDGHFPGAPVLPGAYLLALVLHALEQQPALRARAGAVLQVKHVKFLAPVAPGRTLRIRLQTQAQAIDFAVHCGDTLVARGQVAAEAAAA